jgi:hypothetical protein
MSESKTVRIGVINHPSASRLYGEVTFDGLLESEVAMLEAMVMGVCRVECVEGRLVRRSMHEALPEPGEDPLIAPYWAPSGEPKTLGYIAPDDEQAHHSPSIVIQHLCGYGWTPENYQKAANTLESWGLVCLRSRRGDDGRHWEIWLLHFYAARGDLEAKIRSMSGKEDPSIMNWTRSQLNELGSWIAHRVPFGSLDCTVQRMAMLP